MAKSKKAPARSAEADIEALFAGDAGGFTARRNELAKNLAEAGEGDGAKRVRAMRKPSKAAWAVNQISHSEPKLRDRLLAAGASLRGAAARDSRSATEAERDAVGEAVSAAQELAEAHGAPLSQAAADKVRQTLHAVALDEQVRDQFARGVLAEEHEAVGVGPFATGTAPARTKMPATKRRRDALKAAQAEERKRRTEQGDAERELEHAAQEADRAQRALGAAEKALEKAKAKAGEAAEKVKALDEG